MKNLKTFVDTNKGGELLRMNLAFQEAADESGAKLMVGDAYYQMDEKDETAYDMFQAVEVSRALAETLASFGAVIEPSLESIHDRFYKEENFDDLEIRIVSPDVTYSGKVCVAMLSQLASLWTDTNDWKEEAPSLVVQPSKPEQGGM